MRTSFCTCLSVTWGCLSNLWTNYSSLGRKSGVEPYQTKQKPHTAKKNNKIINSLLSYITVKSFSVFMIIIHLQNLLILQTKVLLQETFQKKTPNDNGMSEFKYLMVWNEWMLTYRSL